MIIRSDITAHTRADLMSGQRLRALRVCKQMSGWRKQLWRPERRLLVRSHLSAFSQLQGILYVNAQVAHRAVDLGMAEKDLNGAEVARRLVND